MIREFDTRWEAEQAVRRLEQHNVSIQDLVIADRTQRTWRRLHNPSEQHAPRRFLVFMIGEPADIERVRTRMHAQVPSADEAHRVLNERGDKPQSPES